MQVTGFQTNWPLYAPTKPQAAQPTDGQDSATPAGAADTATAPAHKAAPLPFASMMDALLNAQSQTSPLRFGADGKPDLRLSLMAGLPPQGGAPGVQGAVGAVQVMTWSDNGSADAFSLAGQSSDDVARSLIQQAGDADGLSLSGVLKSLHIDTTTDAGKAVAQGIEFAWGKLAHGQSGPISAADLAAAIQGYRSTHGDEVSAGGAAWRG